MLVRHLRSRCANRPEIGIFTYFEAVVTVYFSQHVETFYARRCAKRRNAYMRIPRCELAQAQPCKMGLAHKADKRDLTEAFKAMPQEIPFATDKKTRRDGRHENARQSEALQAETLIAQTAYARTAKSPKQSLRLFVFMQVA